MEHIKQRMKNVMVSTSENSFFQVIVTAVFKVSRVSKYCLWAVSQMTMGNKSHVQEENSICKVEAVKYNKHKQMVESSKMKE